MKLKKFLALLLALIMVFALAACGETVDEDDGSDSYVSEGQDTVGADEWSSVSYMDLIEAYYECVSGERKVTPELLRAAMPEEWIEYYEEVANGDIDDAAEYFNRGFREWTREKWSEDYGENFKVVSCKEVRKEIIEDPDKIYDSEYDSEYESEFDFSSYYCVSEDLTEEVFWVYYAVVIESSEGTFTDESCEIVVKYDEQWVLPECWGVNDNPF